MEASNDLFINLIQNHRIIYDKSLKDFKNTRKKEQTWENIANQSRMTVDSAKKRYFSLRQKYCREKRNIEVRRRSKLPSRRPWVYFERLHFLDSFILPRLTFTNDTGFLEDNEEEVDENDVGNVYEGDVERSKNIDIDVDESIDINEVSNIYHHDSGALHSNLQISEEDNQYQCERSHNYSEEVLSEYTGQISRIDYMSSPATFLSHTVIHTEPVTDNVNSEATAERHEELGEPFNMDSYMSPYPSTSSAAIKRNLPSSSNEFIRPLPRANPTAGNIASTSRGNSMLTPCRHKNGKELPRNSQKSGGTGSTSAPKHTISQNQLHAAQSTLLSNHSVQSSSSTMSAASHAGTKTAALATSKEKSIDEIRHKMDSCLNAFANKVNDKTQRSPHAPFLAYLGTKLPNVPKETLPNLEQEILDLVKFHSK